MTTYDPGDVWTPELTVRNAAGDLTAAAVALSVTSPTGTASSPAVSTTTTGVYTANVALTEPGQWLAVWTVSGAVTGVEPQSVFVRSLGATFLTVDDLIPFADIAPAKARQMIDDATAMAMLAAPCLATLPTTLTDVQVAAVKAVLRGAVIRWNEAGSGAVQTQGVGPFSMGLDTRQQRRAMFWPSEITQLQSICRTDGPSGAFTIDTVSSAGYHADVCAINFGAGYCSCGYDLTLTAPLYEV